MKNFIQEGRSLDLIAPAGGVVAGNIVVIGSLIGVAATTAAQTLPFTMSRTGVYGLAKVSAQAWAAGAKIYWDSATKLATTTVGSNTLIGTAIEDAANPSSVGKVLLGPTTV
jgi:predicted RecA/RadA family phage recombinase